MTVPKGGRSALTHALTALVGAGALWLSGHAIAPATAAPQEAAALRSAIDALNLRLDTLNTRLAHLEGAWDARRAYPASSLQP